MDISKNSFLFEIWEISINPFLSLFFVREHWTLHDALSKSSIKPQTGLARLALDTDSQGVIGNRVCQRCEDLSGGRLWCLGRRMEAVWAPEECQGCQSLHGRLSLSCHNSHHSARGENRGCCCCMIQRLKMLMVKINPALKCFSNNPEFSHSAFLLD